MSENSAAREDPAARLPDAASAAARDENPPSPETAAAAARYPHDDQVPPGFVRLVERISALLPDLTRHGLPRSEYPRARHLLEASNGDVDIAAGLYWEDYLLSSAALEHNDNHGRQRRAQNDQGIGRRVRRRAEGVDNGTEEEEEEAESLGHGNHAEELGGEQRPENRPGDHGRGGESDEEEEDEPEGRLPENQNLQEALPRVGEAEQVQVRGEETVSVSDDEIDGVGDASVVRHGAARMRGQRSVETIERDSALNVSGDIEAGVDERSNMKGDVHDEATAAAEDTYLSDSDWILRNYSAPTPLQSPLAVLWGRPHLPSTGKAKPCSSPERPGALDNLVFADDGEDGENLEDNEETGDDEEGIVPPPRAKIPRSWMNVGFNVSSLATGLAAKPPPDDEFYLFRWRQSQSNGGAQIPPPHHCRAVTAVLSVVTALIYSGVSLQGTNIDNSADRKPFAELSEEDRKREFESRLVDALTSLLYLAASVSMERKKRGLAKREAGEDELVTDDTASQEKIFQEGRRKIVRRRLQLCPTCRWEDELRSSEISDARDILIAVSYTRMEDLRCYVLSNMRAFTSPGGCAVFLENIIRIHGETCVERMLREARRDAGNDSVTCSLIHCSCRERQKDMQVPKTTNATFRDQFDTTPLGHCCISTEMISLLLTGKIRCSFKGWSTDRLGIGILAHRRDLIGESLMHSAMPVWVVRGETCYSVLWHDDSKEKVDTSKVDSPGAVLHLVHWNCWYGERSKTEVRIITARKGWKPPTFRKADDGWSSQRTITDSILHRRQEQVSNVVSSDEHGNESTSDSEYEITDNDIDGLVVNPEDTKLYPGSYRLWRYSWSAKSPVCEDYSDKKKPAIGTDHVSWVPYFRLGTRQRLIVEMKLSSKINRILWTRWPGATVDHIEPMTPEPIV